MSTKIGHFFSTKYMANDDFSDPPQRADSKNPIFFFSRFLGLGHLQGPGVRLGRILGVLSIQPFLGEGGVRPEGSIDCPPPRKRKPGLPCSVECNSVALQSPALVPCGPSLRWYETHDVPTVLNGSAGDRGGWGGGGGKRTTGCLRRRIQNRPRLPAKLGPCIHTANPQIGRFCLGSMGPVVPNPLRTLPDLSCPPPPAQYPPCVKKPHLRSVLVAHSASIRYTESSVFLHLWAHRVRSASCRTSA